MPGHEVVTRPYFVERFGDGSNVSEIIPGKVEILANVGKLQIGDNTRSVMAQRVIELYEGNIIGLINKPDMFLSFCQKKIMSDGSGIVPFVQLYKGDILLGNPSIDGFLRPIIVGNEGVNYRRLKKDMYEVIRLSQSGVLEVGNLYLGYRIGL